MTPPNHATRLSQLPAITSETAPIGLMMGMARSFHTATSTIGLAIISVFTLTRTPRTS